jgi:hypothetical protein
MTRSREGRIAVLEAKLKAHAAAEANTRSIPGRIRASRVLLEEAFLLIREAD